MIALQELLLRARIETEALQAWVEAGWVTPHGAEQGFAEIDLARVCLIRDLRQDLGVNDEGIAVALDLLDQVHGLRLALRRIVAGLHDLPEPLRRDALQALGTPEPGDGWRPGRPKA